MQHKFSLSLLPSIHSPSAFPYQGKSTAAPDRDCTVRRTNSHMDSLGALRRETLLWRWWDPCRAALECIYSVHIASPLRRDRFVHSLDVRARVQVVEWECEMLSWRDDWPNWWRRRGCVMLLDERWEHDSLSLNLGGMRRHETGFPRKLVKASFPREIYVIFLAALTGHVACCALSFCLNIT